MLGVLIPFAYLCNRKSVKATHRINNIEKLKNEKEFPFGGFVSDDSPLCLCGEKHRQLS